MVSVLRYHEISESSHRIMNPLSFDNLLLLGDICRLAKGTRMLDLACGKGEMLCLFARDFGVGGVGIDIHGPYLADARARAAELGVEGTVRFIEGDAGDPPELGERFDIVSCIGATWIGGGLNGTLALMGPLVVPGGWLLVGEVYWAETPPSRVREKYETGQDFADLAGTLHRFEASGVDLVEIVLSSPQDWDRYEASQWRNVADWLASNPEDAEAAEILEERDRSRRDYLADERRCLGWGVFVLRAQR
ncbi:MAG: SAM-dependent methyltransferase [Acidimicrobiales bacterium]|jgi:SAM-dependent methyltransferase